MSAYKEYNPLSKIELANKVTIEPKGLVVVVGPNSSGKTHFLQDIRKVLLTGQLGPFVVCKVLDVQPPRDGKKLFDNLVSLEYLTPANNMHQINLPNLEFQQDGQPLQAPGAFPYGNYENAVKAFNQERGANNTAFFSLIGRTLTNFLSIHQRISATNPVRKTGAPTTPINALQQNSDAHEKLAKETARVFGNAVFLDQNDSEVFRLRVTGSPNVPSMFQVSDARHIKSYREITSEGDGYRSYVSTCMALLLGTRPVCLVDEPELCLHPPQAYEIGRFIGANAVHDNHVTFVSTHSSHVLRGILETAKDPKILRLVNGKNGFIGHFVKKAELDKVTQDVRVRAESILDGIFSRAVCIVESDGDRAVYQVAMDDVGETYKRAEIHFVPVYGNAFVPPCQFFKALNIPFAIIADLDQATDKGKVNSILEYLDGSTEIKKEILSKVSTVFGELQKVEPLITPDQAKAKLKQLSEMDLKWESGDDGLLKRELESLKGTIKRLKRLKKGGIDAYRDSPVIHALLSTIIDKCAELGLFFVPVGELEEWATGEMQGVQESNKPARAMIAAEKIKKAVKKEGDVWAFVASVLRFLTSER